MKENSRNVTINKIHRKKSEKPLDFLRKNSIIYLVVAELCKGSTTDSDSVCLGSNPSSAAK